VGRIIVAPDLQGCGLGSALLRAVQVEAHAAGMRHLELFTGKASSQNLALYRRHGYVDGEAATDDRGITLQVLRKAL
jgi:ribosomal protein S18 acetylase RimI-like enzyme